MLLYGSPPSEIAMDDRLLAHLKVVIVSKLRRNEPFLLSWAHGPDPDAGRESLWIHPSIPLRFLFEAHQGPRLNPTWLNEMARSSMSADGLIIGPEPPEEPENN